MLVSTASSVPATSKATSTSPRCCLASSGVSTISAPHLAAAVRRCASGSTAITDATPAARATWISSSPMGPQPTMATELANRTWPRSKPWRATPRGSRMAAVAGLKPSGTGCRRAVGQARTPASPRRSRRARQNGPGAQVGVAFPAPRAVVVGDGGVHRHPAPVQAASLHRPAELVAEDQGPVENGVPNAALAEPMQVRPAHPDGRHAHQALAGARLGRGSSTSSNSPGAVSRNAFIVVFICRPFPLSVRKRLSVRNRRRGRVCERNGAPRYGRPKGRRPVPAPLSTMHLGHRLERHRYLHRLGRACPQQNGPWPLTSTAGTS